MNNSSQSEDKKLLDMKQVNKILKTPSESRTLKQCAELIGMIGDLQFFKEYNAHPESADVPKLCCKYMEIEKFEENEIIFELGSVGNKFYIILQGSVGVYIKKQPATQQQSKSEDKNADDSNKLSNFMMVKELGDGSAFGELALLNNKPRLATISCLKETYVATLSKENFNKILKEHEEQKLNKEIQFFERVPSFKGFNQKQIRFMCLNNKIIKTKKNEVIFDEKDPCDCIYVIKEGEFEIYKSIEKQVDKKEEQLKQSILSMSVLNKNTSQKITKQIKIKVLSVGETIGEEIFLNKNQREFKLVCSSINGVVVKIKASDFLRKLNEDPVLQSSLFKNFKTIYEENQETVQKRIQQFNEYKNYLVQDSLPTKIKMSIEKLYSNNLMTKQEKQENITEFRKQIVEMENLSKKSQFKEEILSKSVLNQRFDNANSLTFQNQVQYLKHKRLSVLADYSQKMTDREMSPQQENNKNAINNEFRRSSLQNQIAGMLSKQAQKKNSILKTQPDFFTQDSQVKLKTTHSQSNLYENPDQDQNNLSGEQQNDNYKTSITKQNSERSKVAMKRRNYIKNNFHSSESLKSTNAQINELQNVNLYQLSPIGLQKQQKSDEFKGQSQTSEFFISPKLVQKHSENQAKYQILNFSHDIGKRYVVTEDNEEDLSSPNPIKNKSIQFSNQIQYSQRGKNETVGITKNITETENITSPRMETQLYQFNVPINRIAKLTNIELKQDNFIRDWKKSQKIKEDAQQQSLVRKIKKLTSSSNKMNDYFNQQSTSNKNDQNTKQSISNTPKHISSNQNGQKSENMQSNNQQNFMLPKINDNTLNVSNFIFVNNSLNGNIEADTPKKLYPSLTAKRLQINPVAKEKSDKKRQLLIVS